MSDNGTFWTQYMNALLGIAPGQSLAGLQLATEAQAFFGPADGQPQQNAALHAVADPLPNWAVMYTPSTTGLFTQYGEFLNGIQLSGQNTDPALVTQLGAAIKQLRGDVGQLQTDLDAKASPSIVGIDQQNVDADTGAVSQLLQKINGPNYAMIGDDLTKWQFAQEGAAAGSAGNQYTMPIPTQNPPAIQVPLYSLAENVADWLTAAAANAKSGAYQESVSFSQGTSSSYQGSYSSQQNQSESIFFGVWDESSSAWSQVQFGGGQSIQYTVQMDLPGAELFTVSPGPWFDGTLVKDFQKGPFAAGSTVAPPAVLFGPSGIFNLVVTQLLLVYAPIVTITFDENTWRSYSSAWGKSSTSAISVGPFYAKTRHSSSSGSWATATNDAENYKVTIKDDSGIARVLAVVANILP